MLHASPRALVAARRVLRVFGTAEYRAFYACRSSFAKIFSEENILARLRKNATSARRVLREFPFTRHPEPSRRLYTSSRTNVRDPLICYNLSLARGFLVISLLGMTKGGGGRYAALLLALPRKVSPTATDEGSNKETIPVLFPSSVPSGQLPSKGKPYALPIMPQGKPRLFAAWSILTTLPPRCARHPPLHREGKIRGL